MWTVYKHTNKVNGKVYIGITSNNPIDRWGVNGEGYKTQPFYKFISEFGWGNFSHEILFTHLEQNEAYSIESALIKTLQSDNPLYGYNSKSGNNYHAVVFSDNENDSNYDCVDTILLFINQNGEIKNNTVARDLYSKYVNWCNNKGVEICSKKKFTSTIVKQGYKNEPRYLKQCGKSVRVFIKR